MNLKTLINPISIPAYFLGTVFLSRGISKIIMLREFLDIMVAYRIIPIALIPSMSLILISLELGVGLGLFAKQYRIISSLISIFLLIFFISHEALAYFRSLETESGCSFLFLRNISPKLIIRDIVLLVLAVLVYRS